tara:strand:- start:27 stop:239 length:213 start_codon:yes stop_codon:yes gene_type:complete
MPEIDIRGSQGNAFALMGTAKSLARQLGYDREETEEILNEMRSGSYEDLLDAFDKYFPVVELIGRNKEQV